MILEIIYLAKVGMIICGEKPVKIIFGEEQVAAVEFTAGWFGSPRGSAAPLGGGNAGAFSMGSSAGSGGKSARLRKGHHE